jgi:threonine aldolase
MASMPAAPERAFSSDNAAGALPAVVEAVVAANEGHARAYGADRWTDEALARFRDIFGPSSQAFLVWNGTGANVMSLASMVQPADCVVCTEWSHIHVDETGAPERALGAKLVPLASGDGKLVPEQLAELRQWQGVQHHAQPGVVSITQSTELGSVYTADEVAALCDTAHGMGMLVHLDGARIANATAALGGTLDALRSFTVDAGVDVLSFGGTKAGLLGGEAVVYLTPELARRAVYVRKMVNQLPSKMRFVAAQFNALLHDDLWIRSAQHSNAMATRLYEATRAIPGVSIERAPEVNSLFATLPADAIASLQAWSFFWDWDLTRGLVRWMTSWDTTDTDVARFSDGVRHLLASPM